MAARGRRDSPRGAHLRSLASPLAVREFRLIWLAELASTVGDWASRLALSVVVLERTDSATVMSLVVGASLVAWIGPGQLLSQVADRYGRRAVMVGSDLLRAAMFIVLAFPVPTWGLLLGAALAGLATPPFAAARSAATRELLPPARYGPAMALSAMTMDAGTVLGYAVGGAILAVTTPEGALLLNAGTFVVSAILCSRLPATPPAHIPHPGTRGHTSALRMGLAAVLGQPLVRLSVGVAVLAAASGVGIESLAVVYNARDLDGPSWVPGTVLASVAAVSLIITAALPHKGSRRVLVRAAGITSLAGSVVTILGFMSGSHAGAILGFVAAGSLFAVLAPANVVVGPLLPAQVRASAFSILMGILVVCQSLGAALAGTLADHLSTPTAAMLVCIPGLLAGGWALVGPAPAGIDDDVEAPLPSAAFVRHPAPDPQTGISA